MHFTMHNFSQRTNYNYKRQLRPALSYSHDSTLRRRDAAMPVTASRVPGHPPSPSRRQGARRHGDALEKGSAILSPTPVLAKAPQIYICLIQGSEEIITKAFYSIADRLEFDLFVDALYLLLPRRQLFFSVPECTVFVGVC